MVWKGQGIYIDIQPVLASGIYGSIDVAAIELLGYSLNQRKRQMGQKMGQQFLFSQDYEYV